MTRAAKITAAVRAARGSAEDMAARIDNATVHLIEELAAAGGISSDDARKVAGFYIKNKLVSSDFAIGRYRFKHGAYLDRDTVRRALEMAA